MGNTKKKEKVVKTTKKVLKIDDDIVDNKSNISKKKIGVKEEKNNNKKSVNTKNSKTSSKKVLVNDDIEEINKKKKVLTVDDTVTDTKSNKEKKKKVLVNDDIVKDNVLSQKEINRKNYEKRQAKYREKNKVVSTKKTIVPKEDKVKEIKIDSKTKEEKIKKSKKVKSKKNSKLNKVFEYFKEELDDNNIFLDNIISKKERIRRYTKEASIYAIAISIINLILYYIFDYINLINLFDVKIFNFALTLFVFLMLSFLVCFAIDYIVSEIWYKLKIKKIGDDNGDKRIKPKKHRENI